MGALDLLEKRIDLLNNILGLSSGDYDNQCGDDEQIKRDTNSGENFVDSLLSANTLISSAISGRENITKIVNRSKELENYLDPNFLDNCQQIKSKEVYVNTVAPELAGNFEVLNKIKELEPTLGAEYFRNIPDATDKLKTMSDNTTDLNEHNDVLEENLIMVMKRYNEIQNNITESIRVMNEKLDKIEEKIQKKKRTDD